MKEQKTLSAEENKKLIENIKIFKAENGISTVEFSEICGINASTMGHYIKGDYKIGYENAEKIRKAMKKTLQREVPASNLAEIKKQRDKKSKKDTTTAVSIKGSAKGLVDIVKAKRKYRYDYEAAAVLVKIGFEAVSELGFANFDFTPFEDK